MTELGQNTFNELLRQLDMITDSTSLTNWAHNVKCSVENGKVNGEERLTLLTMYKIRKAKVRQ